MIAGGLGCRKGCDADTILRAIEQALAAAGKSARDLHALYTPDWKRTEAGLARAAAQLDKPLVYLPLEALRAQAPLVLTHSEHVERHFGLPGVAETAALAGAQRTALEHPRLLGPRVVVAGATCALAEFSVEESIE